MTIKDEIRGHDENFLINSFKESFLEIVCLVVASDSDHPMSQPGFSLNDPLSDMLDNDVDFLDNLLVEESKGIAQTKFTN